MTGQFSDELLHVYGQESEHSDAFLLGTRGALLRLLHGIEQALATGRGTVWMAQNDGECYPLNVYCVAEPWMQAMPGSYDIYAGNKWDEGEIAAFDAAMDGRASDISTRTIAGPGGEA